MKDLAFLNKYFYRYRWRLLLGFIFVVCSNYFRILQPRVIRQALDMVVENVSVFNLFENFDNKQLFFSMLGKNLLFFGGLVLLFAILMGIFMYFMRQTIVVMSRLIEYDMRKEIFGHYENLSLSFYKMNNTGDLMSRITEDVAKVRMYLGPGVLYAINLVSLFVMVIYSMLSVNVELTLYCLAPLPILSISIYYVSNLINKKSTVIQEQLSKLNSISQEVYSGIRVVKSYVQETPMGNFFTKESDDFKDKSMELVKVNAFFFPLMLLLIGTSTIITVYLGGRKVVTGEITPGTIAEFVIYINMLTWPVTAIGWIASIVQQAAASQRRINEFLNTKPEIVNQVDSNANLDGAIEFKNVSFVYPDSGTKAIQQMSFSLKAGEKMAIIGKTGSGKSTIADLLVRMYNINEGEIKIDGKNILQHDMHNLRRRVGYVPQDVFLFSDTISDNIAFGKPNASQEDIEQFTKYASVYDDIMGLTNQFETMVGERGVTLSGGQKQRISIARALLKEPDILILDDCLSAVDANTEQQILSYLNTQLENKTAIIITHRIYAMLNFDKIIVLEDGKIIEEGTHRNLLSKKGFYYKLYQQQSVENQEIKS